MESMNGNADVIFIKFNEVFIFDAFVIGADICSTVIKLSRLREITLFLAFANTPQTINLGRLPFRNQPRVKVDYL
jgi:hypothetical protein